MKKERNFMEGESSHCFNLGSYLIALIFLSNLILQSYDFKLVLDGLYYMRTKPIYAFNIMPEIGK